MKFISSICCVLFLISCGNNSAEEKENSTKENTEKHKEEGIHLSFKQAEILGLKIDTLSKRTMGGFVEANGRLEVPPQNEATVTTSVGANVVKIEVIEGEEVEQGQVIAYLSHPNIIQLQSNYLEAFHQLKYLEKEYQRQKKLYEGGVGSGMNFQKAEAEYKAKKGMLSGSKSKLKLLNISLKNLEQGNIQERVALCSPIEGAVQKVEVKTGQYVQPQTDLFEIINTHHVHADLMVYEKDVYKIEKGQKIKFTIQSLPGSELTAQIYSISKTFEDNPKAVHVHAEIENKKGNLIPGMYIQGRILTDNSETTAISESAIITKGNRFYIYKTEKNKNEWNFIPVEVKTGKTDGAWTAIQLLEKQPSKTLFAYNNAYYIQAEAEKGEGGGHHH
ncbi:efflux RND transporter periplasmic adaptor subunit [Mesonia aestuariivivens]|nr:efflux RND transporter periplasmic adaptor subunit [Mesonia aestuariivivens]